MNTDESEEEKITDLTISSSYFPVWVDATTLLVVARVPGSFSIDEELMIIDVQTKITTDLCPNQYYGKVCSDQEKPFSIAVRNGRMETKD